MEGAHRLNASEGSIEETEVFSCCFGMEEDQICVKYSSKNIGTSASDKLGTNLFRIFLCQCEISCHSASDERNCRNWPFYFLSSRFMCLLAQFWGAHLSSMTKSICVESVVCLRGAMPKGSTHGSGMASVDCSKKPTLFCRDGSFFSFHLP